MGARDFGAGHPATYPTFALRLPIPPRCKKTKIPAGGYEIMPPGGVTLWEDYLVHSRILASYLVVISAIISASLAWSKTGRL